MAIQITSHHLVSGEIIRVETGDRRTFFGRWSEGGLELNTKRDFKGRTARIHGSELGDWLFEKARNQGRIDRMFGEAREVRAAAPKPDRPPFLFGTSARREQEER